MSDPESRVGAPDASSPSEAATATLPPPEAPKPRPGAAGRRRLVWGLIVVLIGVALGASVGWGSQVPIYRSAGLIYIEPSMPTPADPGGRDVLPMFEGFVAGQVQLLQTKRAAESAMRTETWQRTGEGFGPAAVEQFTARCRIVHEPGTQHIQVLFHDPRPEVARAGVRALIETYQTLAREVNDADQRLEFARMQVHALNDKMRNLTQELLTLTQEYGGVEGMQVRHLAAVEQVLEAERELQEVRTAFAAYVAPKHLTAEEIAVESQTMAQFLDALARLEAEAEALLARVTEEHHQLKALRAKISHHEARIATLAAEWNLAREREAGGGRTLEELRAVEKALEARLVAQRVLSRRIGQTRVEVERLQAERDDLARQLEQMNRLRDQLENQLLGSGRIRIFSSGSLPTEPYEDGRALYAGIGAAAGGLGALLFVLLFAFVARRVGRAADADAYHAKVRASVALLPKRIGEWRSHDVPVPSGAARMPKANLAMGREFQNPSTGENATLRIVQCKDARDLSAYYPPIQYPAEGWTLREAEPRHLPALLAAIPGTVYRFTKESADGSSEVLVYNFFARPDGSIESGPAGALHAAAETHTQALGAAQFQILLGPSMTRDRRDEVFRTLIAAALPVMDALCVEDDA